MSKKIGHHNILFTLFLLLWGLFSLVTGQYYYFDNSTSYPFQQWCSESLMIKINTEGEWVRAGRFHLIIDSGHFSYSTSDVASILRTNLFNASSATFADRSSSASPSWKPGSDHTILQIDRKNDLINYIWNGWAYWTIIGIVPLFSATTYTWYIAMEYISWSATTETTLSAPGGYELINPAHQTPYITWYFYVQQAPCVTDTNAPSYVVNTPTAGTKKSHLSWLSINLTDNIWSSSTNVPYVRTGWIPGVGTWTINNWWINNQYWVDLNSFFISVSGNGTGKYLYGSAFDFLPGSSLFAAASGMTWQFLNRNYYLNINWSELFDYGIEKPITIVWTVRDRMNNSTNFWPFVFNQPVWPWLIAGSDTPTAWAEWIDTNAPIIVWIADDRAGVDSWSIRVTLQGIWWTVYGPYIFSGSDLNLSWVIGNANQPDYFVHILNHPDFPNSWTIQVHVYAEDMVGTIDTIGDYIFWTRPSCMELGCCSTITIQTWTNLPFVYSGTTLMISGWINPSFTTTGNTWTLYCGTENQGMDIYKWTETSSWTATYISFFDSTNLSISGNNSTVKAVLSGKTLYLQKLYIPPITTWWCIGSCWWTGGGWGGGWGGSITAPDDCTLPSNLACANETGVDASESYYDNTCCSSTEETWHAAAPTCDVSDSPYTREITDAFQRWYNLNITNKCPITAARMESPIIRMEAAKMMSMFTIQIIGLFPDTHKQGCDKFPDAANLSDEMQFFIKTACQLDLMGLKPDGKTPDKVFNPHDYVDRAQFGTMLSRLIYGDKYNIYSGEETLYKWYEKHLAALHADNIMKKIENPSMLEERARVLLMLKRTADSDIVSTYRLIAPAHNGALVLLENVR